MIQRDLDLPQSDTLSSQRSLSAQPTAAQVVRIKDLHERHLTPSRIAERIGVNAAAVRSALGMPPPRKLLPLRESDIPAIQADAAAGRSLTWLAKHYGISRGTAQRVCADVARPDRYMDEARVRGGHASQETKARERAARFRVIAARVLLAESVEVPDWVPKHLRDTYERVGMFKGEHEAAAVIRRLKGSRA